MEAVRTRDFIETTDGLIFSAVSYVHPPDRYIAFLRYYPDPSGERVKDGRAYRKVASTALSFDWLEKNHPDYLFYSDVTGGMLQGVPLDRVERIYRPQDALARIVQEPGNPVEEQAAELSEVLEDIPPEKKGVTGSLLLGLEGGSSDIDFVVYGRDSHQEARELLQELLEEYREGELIRPLTEEEWMTAYEKRFPGVPALSFEEFLWHEQRKYHKAAVGDTPFDILMVRDWDEIQGVYGEEAYIRGKEVKMVCTVTDAAYSFDSPSVYGVAARDRRVSEVVSFTHTYAGQAREGEKIEVQGYLEEVRGRRNTFRIVVGTTREAEGEYIKVVSPSP
ncbi:MAG: DNA polymerase subunit beta [Euryarchaeota archaeon]|nr:DNA polymerase subunit beta [Euryarchaeota archaeon]